MNISEALGESKSLAVSFGSSTLNIQYAPPNYTIEQMSAAMADRDDPERLADMLMDLVSGWDLTRTVEQVADDGLSTVPIEVPIDVTDRAQVIKYVPSPIIMGIVKAIRKDNDPSGE